MSSAYSTNFAMLAPEDASGVVLAVKLALKLLHALLRRDLLGAADRVKALRAQGPGADADRLKDVVEGSLVQRVLWRHEHWRQDIQNGGVLLALRLDQEQVKLLLELVGHDRLHHGGVLHDLGLVLVFWDFFCRLGVGVDRLNLAVEKLGDSFLRLDLFSCKLAHFAVFERVIQAA